MSATLGSAAVSSATARVPRYTAAVATVALVDDTVLPTGVPTTLTIGDLSMLGTIRAHEVGADFGGQARYTWIAGAGAWSSSVKTQPYHDDNGIMLSRVLADLAKDAGEIGCVLDGLPDKSLGLDWTRPAGLASDQLEALSGGQWWVNASDGVTHVGPRPASAVSSPNITVEPFDGALSRAVVRVADDTFSALLPGATLTAEGLPGPLTVAATTLHVDGASISAELWAEVTGPELLRRIVAHLTAGTLFHRRMPYAVASVASDGRVAVQPADGRATAFPDAPLLAHVAGLPGVSVVLVRGARVLVDYIAGDPASPVVAGYFPDVAPQSIAMAVQSGGTVNVGGNRPLCDGNIQEANNVAIAAALAAAGHPVSLQDPRTTITRGA